MAWLCKLELTPGKDSVKGLPPFRLTMSSDHLLSVRNLSCLKDDGTPIFEGVSFDIDKGVYCLTGRSGSG